MTRKEVSLVLGGLGKSGMAKIRTKGRRKKEEEGRSVILSFPYPANIVITLQFVARSNSDTYNG